MSGAPSTSAPRTRDALWILVVVAGEAGEPEALPQGLEGRRGGGAASAVLAASRIHFGVFSIAESKALLSQPPCRFGPRTRSAH